MSGRPSVSVIVPFAGPPEALERLIDALIALRLRDEDEVIVAHNRRPAGHRELRGRILVLGAGGVRSPAYARNQAAGIARGRWLAFLDSDTVPDSSLVEQLFQPEPEERTAILAGEIEDVSACDGLLARHTLARRPMSQELTLSGPGFGYAQTANCAVRADAFSSVGGFVAGARAGEDADLCLRLQQAGWRLERRRGAVVTHRARPTLR
ncbi:MAG: glycosyltransferase, partial [Actinomycetota bacterium]|nr:glycosyltransferase [Actinomycetota bacterium]